MVEQPDVPMPEWDPTRFRYEQIADHMEARIRAGRWRPGARLPAEAELATEYGVARMTMRRATVVLVDRGLVRVLHGRGTFVLDRPPPEA